MKKSAWVATLVGLVVVVLVSGTTFALFSAQSSNTANNITSGTLCLDNKEGKWETQALPGPMFSTLGVPGLGDALVPAGVWAPGDTQQHFLAVYNNCTLDARLDNVLAVNATGNLALAQYMTVKVTYLGLPVVNAPLNQFLSQSFPLQVPNAQTGVPSTLVLPAGKALDLSFEVSLALATPNAYQDAFFQVDFQLNATQARNTVGILGQYYSGTNLAGTPVTVIDPQVNVPQNGNGGPFNLGNDFSVRWTGNLNIPTSGTYTFTTTTDDGVRVYLDGSTIIDNWTPHGPTNNTSSPISLGTGPHTLVVEYFECCGAPAVIQLSWNGPAGNGIIPASYYTVR